MLASPPSITDFVSLEELLVFVGTFEEELDSVITGLIGELELLEGMAGFIEELEELDSIGLIELLLEELDSGIIGLIGILEELELESLLLVSRTPQRFISLYGKNNS